MLSTVEKIGLQTPLLLIYSLFGQETKQTIAKYQHLLLIEILLASLHHRLRASLVFAQVLQA